MSKAFLLCLGVSAWLLASCRQQPAPPLPSGVDVQHYDLTLRLDPPTRSLQARAVLEIRHPDSLTVLPLTFEGLTIDTVRVNGVAVVPRRRGDRLWVPLVAGLRASQVEVVYHGTPRRGLYASAYGSQQVVYTDSWPDRGAAGSPACIILPTRRRLPSA